MIEITLDLFDGIVSRFLSSAIVIFLSVMRIIAVCNSNNVTSLGKNFTAL